MPVGYEVSQMEFHQLRYFVAAAETGSMSRAAEREHVTQPALSRQVAQLERRLGVELFERRRQRIHLTEAGRFFLPRARQILCDAETSRQQLREQFGRDRPTLRLGFVGPFLDDLIAPTVRELRRAHRGSKVALFDLAPRAQLERLVAGELDAGVLANLDAQYGAVLRSRRLSRHRFAAVLPHDHALAQRAQVGLAQLRDEAWVSLDDSLFPGRRAFLDEACGRAGFEPEVVAETSSVGLMLGAVSSGDGVAIAPLHSRKLPHEGCAFVPLKAPVPRVELVFVSRRDDRRAVVDALHAVLRARAIALFDEAD